MKGLEALTEALLRATDRIYTVPGFPITELGKNTKAEIPKVVASERGRAQTMIVKAIMGL